MKKKRLLIPILLTIVMIAGVHGMLLAVERLAKLTIPSQPVNLDLDNNGRDDEFAMDVELYEDGTVDGQGSLAGRNIVFESGTMSPGSLGPNFNFGIIYAKTRTEPDDPGTLALEMNEQGGFNIIMVTEEQGARTFDIKPFCLPFTDSGPWRDGC